MKTGILQRRKAKVVVTVAWLAACFAVGVLVVLHLQHSVIKSILSTKQSGTNTTQQFEAYSANPTAVVAQNDLPTDGGCGCPACCAVN